MSTNREKIVFTNHSSIVLSNFLRLKTDCFLIDAGSWSQRHLTSMGGEQAWSLENILFRSEVFKETILINETLTVTILSPTFLSHNSIIVRPKKFLILVTKPAGLVLLLSRNCQLSDDFRISSVNPIFSIATSSHANVTFAECVYFLKLWGLLKFILFFFLNYLWLKLHTSWLASCSTSN